MNKVSLYVLLAISASMFGCGGDESTKIKTQSTATNKSKTKTVPEVITRNSIADCLEDKGMPVTKRDQANAIESVAGEDYNEKTFSIHVVPRVQLARAYARDLSEKLPEDKYFRNVRTSISHNDRVVLSLDRDVTEPLRTWIEECGGGDGKTEKDKVRETMKAYINAEADLNSETVCGLLGDKVKRDKLAVAKRALGEVTTVTTCEEAYDVVMDSPNYQSDMRRYRRNLKKHKIKIWIEKFKNVNITQVATAEFPNPKYQTPDVYRLGRYSGQWIIDGTP